MKEKNIVVLIVLGAFTIGIMGFNFGLIEPGDSTEPFAALQNQMVGLPGGTGAFVVPPVTEKESGISTTPAEDKSMKTFSTPISSTNSQTGAIGWYTEDSRTPSVVHYPVQEIVQCSNGDLIHTSTGSFGQKDAQGKVQWTRVQPEGIPS